MRNVSPETQESVLSSITVASGQLSARDLAGPNSVAPMRGKIEGAEFPFL